MTEFDYLIFGGYVKLHQNQLHLCVREKIKGEWFRADDHCHSLFSSVPVIIFSLIIFPWQLIAFYCMHHTNNPGERQTHTHTQSGDVCWRLTAVFDLGSLHHVELLPEETERKRLIFHAVWGGKERGVRPQWNSLIPAICQSKQLRFSSRPNINKHNHVQMGSNEMWQFYWA